MKKDTRIMQNQTQHQNPILKTQEAPIHSTFSRTLFPTIVLAHHDDNTKL